VSTTERPLEGIDDASLFQSAMADPEPAAAETPTPEPATPEPAPQPEGQPRDEHGRFAPKAAEQEQAPQPPTQAAQGAPTEALPPEDQQAAIPSWRLREVAEERNAARQRAEQAEMQARQYAAQLQQYHAELQRYRQPQAPPPDFFENPEQATQAHIQRALEQMVAPQLQQLQQRQLRLDQSLARTEFGADQVTAADKAFSEAVGRGTIDPGDYHRVLNSPNVFAAAVEWHQRQRTWQETGGNLEAYRQKVIEEYISDPKNQAAVIERARNGAVQNGGSRQPVVNLPPSLSRASGTSANVPDDGDMSDASLFRYAMR